MSSFYYIILLNPFPDENTHSFILYVSRAQRSLCFPVPYLLRRNIFVTSLFTFLFCYEPLCFFACIFTYSRNPQLSTLKTIV